MGDLGLSSTFAVGAMQQSVRQRIMDALARQQQQFKNDMDVREADRADRALEQTDAYHKLQLQQMADARAATQHQQDFTLAEKFNEAIPAGTTFPTVDRMAAPSQAPVMGRLQMVGALQPTAGTLSSTTDTPANAATGTPPLGRLMAIPEGQIKLPSAGQQNILADNVRADRALADKRPPSRVIATPGPNGQKIEKSFTDEELQAGVPGYVAPPSSTAGWTATTLKINGVDTPVRVNASTGQVLPLAAGEGDKLAPKAGAVEQNRALSAKTVNDVGASIIQQIQANADKLGPVLSRYNSIADLVGTPPPEFAKLAGEIESFSLANMGVHGMRSATGAEAVKDTIGLGRHDPASLIAILQGLMGFSTRYLENVSGTSAAPSTTPVQGPAAPAAAPPRIRYDINGNRIP